ncbi:MAG: hypothetical protein H8E91_03780 [Planctomycetes bacterium]|nr:hypothetical protein [Planctomycetota bacterium]
MVPMHIFLLFCIFGANFPPIEENEAARLTFAVDGRDSLDDGFAVLVENAMGWAASSEEKAGSVNPAVFLDLVKDPATYRGNELAIAGVIEQQSAAPPPWEYVGEWFVRDTSGTPFVLYVVGESDISAKADIVARARFYKRVDLTGRDGQVRSFATFVTSSSAVESSGFGKSIPLQLLFVPVVVAGALVVFLLSRKKTNQRLQVRDVLLHMDEVIDAVDDASMDLPEDPADALALLHESAEELT